MLKHEEALKKRPDLQAPEPRKVAMGGREPEVPYTHKNDNGPTKSRPGFMALHHVECFKTGKLPEYKTGEFKRQLNGQEDGLNWMTVEEFWRALRPQTNEIPELPKKRG